MHRQFFVFAILMSILGSHVTARDLVVDNVAGSDLQNDRGLVAGSASYGPYRTIQRALIAAGPGDAIVLTDTGVPYRECISLTGRRHSGTELYPFRIIGNGVTLDGSTPANRFAWERRESGIYRYTEPRFGYALLIRPGKPLDRFIMPGDLSQMAPLQWTHRDGYVYFRPERDTSPADHPLELTTEAVGISLYDVQHVVITGLTLRGYRLDGINAHDKANEIQLTGVAAEQNGRSGISIGGSSSVTIRSARCERNGVAQLRTEGQSHTYLSKVNLVPGATVDLLRLGGEVLQLPNQ